MSIELLLLAINLNFATFSIYLDDIIGQIFILFILTIAATESAIGLAIIVVVWVKLSLKGFLKKTEKKVLNFLKASVYSKILDLNLKKQINLKAF